MARPGEIDANKDPVTEKGDKPHPLFQKWLDLLVIAFNNFRRVRDLTSVTSDYRLLVGETAKINITTASTPLNIAVEDGLYEIDILFDRATFGAVSNFQLLVNNAAAVGAFTRSFLRGDTALATDEVDVGITAVDGHGEPNVPAKFIKIHGTVTIFGSISAATITTFGINSAGNPNLETINTEYTAAAHTSLGTILLSEAATAVCYVTRVA